jgi:replicative DNA helicase
MTKVASDLLADLYKPHVESLSAPPTGAAARMTFGFAKLDALTGGFSGSVAIASAPGVGKTSLALQVGVQLLDQEDVAVLFVSPELPRTVILDRTIAKVSGVKLDELRRGGAVDPKCKSAMKTAADWVDRCGSRLAIRGRNEGLGFAELKERVADLQTRTGVTRVLAILDGLQTYAARCRGPAELDKDALDRVTSEWVDGWTTPGVTSLLLSHVPKTAFSSHGQGVFSGSARIEYRVDMAMVLQPPEDRRGKETYQVTVHVTKNWHGAIGEARLVFDAARCRFKAP